MQERLARRLEALYVGTAFLSAVLLFSLQPMIAKLALPLLGGTPAVWAVSLCVFQGLLLAGYCYAHGIGVRLPPRRGGLLHVAVLITGAVVLPVTLPAFAGSPPQSQYHLWLALVLVASIGLPFFALSAHAPLLQKWFSTASRADPYRLYLASNAGSLLALLAYPAVLEPLLSLSRQRQLWALGYVVLIAAIAVCAWAASRQELQNPVTDARSTTSIVNEPTPTLQRRLTWLALSLIPSGLLVAFTTFVTTDLASAPLLWVLPLALFLASFLVAFRDTPPLSMAALAIIQAVAVAAMQVALDWNMRWTWAVSALAGLVAFVAACILCHHALYIRRPTATHLTVFYLWMSLGGVLGGITATLLAPLLFTDVLEFPLLLGASFIATILCRPLSAREATTRHWLLASAAVVLALACFGAIVNRTGWGDGTALRFWTTAALACFVVASIARPALASLAGLAIVAATLMLPPIDRPLHTSRSFFGTHRVVAVSGGRVHTLQHGTTVHGADLRRDANGNAVTRPLPLTYYHPTGPMAKAVGLARQAKSGPRADLDVGIVGLGAGAMACYATVSDRWRYYEIDPDVVRIARTPAYFNYLTMCQPQADIVLGDARQTLARERDRAFDLLLIDAFSSDAIPVHMLTREAIQLFLERLSSRGILALHVSNQTLDLLPTVEATLASISGIAAIYVEGQSGGGALASQVVLIARDMAVLSPATSWHKARRLGPSTVWPWTDDHSDIVMPMLRKMFARPTVTP